MFKRTRTAAARGAAGTGSAGVVPSAARQVVGHRDAVDDSQFCSLTNRRRTKQFISSRPLAVKDLAEDIADEIERALGPHIDVYLIEYFIQLAARLVGHMLFSAFGEHCAYLPGGKFLIQMFECLFERLSVEHRCNIPTCGLVLVNSLLSLGCDRNVIFFAFALDSYGMPEFLFRALLLAACRGREVCLFAPPATWPKTWQKNAIRLTKMELDASIPSVMLNVICLEIQRRTIAIIHVQK